MAVRVASIASALIGLWLGFVVLTVLPRRDPDRIPMWTVVAVAMFGFAALTWSATRPGDQSAARRIVLGFAAVFAVVVGALILASALHRTADFEGYLVLIGDGLVVHGLVSLAYGATRERGFAEPSASP